MKDDPRTSQRHELESAIIGAFLLQKTLDFLFNIKYNV